MLSNNLEVKIQRLYELSKECNTSLLREQILTFLIEVTEVFEFYCDFKIPFQRYLRNIRTTKQVFNSVISKEMIARKIPEHTCIDFLKFLDLADRLLLDKKEFTRRIERDKFYNLFNPNVIEVNKMVLNTDYSYIIAFYKDNDFKFELHINQLCTYKTKFLTIGGYKLSLSADGLKILIDDLLPLYEEAYRYVTELKQNNEKILENIKELVRPYVLVIDLASDRPIRRRFL
jgi:hypothetical protein